MELQQLRPLILEICQVYETSSQAIYKFAFTPNNFSGVPLSFVNSLEHSCHLL